MCRCWEGSTYHCLEKSFSFLLGRQESENMETSTALMKEKTNSDDKEEGELCVQVREHVSVHACVR